MTIDIDQNELISMIAEKLNVDRSNIRINVHRTYRSGLEHFEASVHADTNKSYNDDECGEQCVVTG